MVPRGERKKDAMILREKVKGEKKHARRKERQRDERKGKEG